MEHRQDYSFIRPVRPAPAVPFIGPVHRIKLAPGIADGAGAMGGNDPMAILHWQSSRHTVRRLDSEDIIAVETPVGTE